MAQKFLTDIELTRGLKDSSGDLGNSGQVLSSTGSALNWIDATSAASVVYQDGFTGNGSTTAFTLANSIDNENKTQVYIDGVYQHKDTYSLSGTTLTFSTAPPNSSDIEVISFSSVSSADDILYDTDFASAGLMTTNGSGVYSITTNNSSNWNTAYTYSQVGHLPLAGGTLTGNLQLNDNVKTLYGNSNDLQIFHNGSHSYIEDSGTGDLRIKGDYVKIIAANSENMFSATQNGAVELYYDNSKKFETTNTGVTITGTSIHTGIEIESTSPQILFDETDVTANWRTRASGGSYRIQYASDGSSFSNWVTVGANNFIIETINVGIGTTSPAQKLDVVGSSGDTNIRVYDSSANSEVGLKLQNDAKTWTLQNWGSGGDNLRLLNNAGNIVQLWDDNGKVGIGNFNDPSVQLHVHATSGDGLIRITGDNLTNSGGTIKGFNNGLAFNVAVAGGGGENEVVRITGATLVGISTTNPSEKLSVASGNVAINNSNSFMVGGATGDTIVGRLKNTAGVLNLEGDGTRNIRLGSGTNGELVRINNYDGRVGIGGSTTSANTLTLQGTGTELDISNTSTNGKNYRIASTSSGVLEFIDKAANVERMRIHSDGKIGIGVVPTNNFHVGGVSNYNGIEITGSGASRPSLKFSNINQGQLAQIYGTEGNALVIATGTSSNTAITVDSSQKVGIGNTSPTAALTIGNYTSTHHQNHSSLPTVPGNHLVNLTPPSTTNSYGGGISWSEGSNTAASLGVYDAGGGGALGMYFATGDNTTLTERLRIRSSGTVGIGSAGFDSQMLTIAAGTLDGAIYATSTDANCFASFRDNSSTANIEFGAIGNSHVFRKDATEHMRVDSNGVLQLTTTASHGFINANTVALELDVNRNPETGAFSDTGKSHARIQIAGDNGGSNIKFNTASANNTTASEAMRITKDGNVGINITNPETALRVKGVVGTGAAIHDPNAAYSVTGFGVQDGGALHINFGLSGVSSSGDTIVFTYAATVWKSWSLNYNFASTSGISKGVVGGYWNNSGGSSHHNETDNLGVSVAVTHTGQGNTVTFTFTALGTHPMAHFVYMQSGGDGQPRADRVTLSATT